MTAGSISFGANWTFNNVVITGADGKKLQVTESASMNILNN